MRKTEKDWALAKKKYRLSADTIRKAKELGLNPKKFGSIANHKQQSWKAPLSEFISDIYEKRFCKKSKKEH